MSRVRIAAVVEGYGEVEAVPVLIRRIASDLDPALLPDVLHPIRVPANRLKKEGELERAVELAARKLGGAGGVFVLLDCDWDNGCPKSDAPILLQRACLVRPSLPISLVLAYKEYEAWFIAALASVSGELGITETAQIPSDPEGIRGAKEWLSSHMPKNQGYVETLHQPALTELFDMQSARRANSFDKCYREIAGLLKRLRSSAT